MARALALGATPSAANPVLDFWALVDGALVAPTAVLFSIYDLSTGTPILVAGPTVATHLTETARWLAPWTATGNLGRHRVVWTVTPTVGSTYDEQYDFDVLAAGLALKGPAYCLLSDVRDEGFAASAISDIRALALIRRASFNIERWTRRFFEPRFKTVDLDGARGPSQYLSDPIVALLSAAVDGATVDPASYQIFNRHIAQGLTNPDDRDTPRITFQRVTRTLAQVDTQDRPFLNKQVWWPGPRNVRLTGLFGYTDPDCDLRVGVTPEAIKMATLLLVQRAASPLASDDGEGSLTGRVRSVRTRDQSVDYDRTDLGHGSAANEGWSGNPEIDNIIAQYTAPMFIGSP